MLSEALSWRTANGKRVVGRKSGAIEDIALTRPIESEAISWVVRKRQKVSQGDGHAPPSLAMTLYFERPTIF